MSPKEPGRTQARPHTITQRSGRTGTERASVHDHVRQSTARTIVVIRIDVTLGSRGRSVATREPAARLVCGSRHRTHGPGCVAHRALVHVDDHEDRVALRCHRHPRVRHDLRAARSGPAGWRGSESPSRCPQESRDEGMGARHRSRVCRRIFHRRSIGTLRSVAHRRIHADGRRHSRRDGGATAQPSGGAHASLAQLDRIGDGRPQRSARSPVSPERAAARPLIGGCALDGRDTSARRLSPRDTCTGR